MYIRVVEVTGNAREPVLLENDDVLRPRDVVCLLDELPPGAKPTPSNEQQVGVGSGPDKYRKRLENVFLEGGGGYVKGSGSSRPLEEYTLKKGKIDFLVRTASWFVRLSPRYLAYSHKLSNWHMRSPVDCY